MPGPFPAPLSSAEADAGRPSGMDGRGRETATTTSEAPLTALPTTSCSAPRIRAGHPGGPEPAGPERFPPDDFKRF